MSLIRKIPIIGKKIKRLRLSQIDIIHQLVDRNKEILFIDVGANRGQTIDFVLKNFKKPKIYSFEPTEELCSLLIEKYVKNDNVHIQPFGLADEKGEVDFFLSDFDATNSILKPNIELYQNYGNPVDLFPNSRKRTIKVDTFDNWYYDNLNGALVDVLKIDVQGYEYNVLLGGIKAIKSHVRIIYFEIQYLDFYKDAVPFYKIFELLYDNGFYYYSQVNANVTKAHQILESDVFFVNKNV